MNVEDAAASKKSEPRFVVGIDLGTTNSAVCYVDTSATETSDNHDTWDVRTLKVPQLVAPGQVEHRDTLPSFHYQPAAGEFSDGELQLPWSNAFAGHFVGTLARDHGIHVPGRMISSAKSWLCHPGVDRTAGILPWQGGDDVDRLSPVEVSSRLLAHVVDVWNHQFPDEPLADQTVVLTIPASFDEVARNLTIQASQKAGLPRVLLIEEPQAAFYAWIDRHRGDWEDRVQPGQKILVCDVGGGTTDFTLIRVKSGADNKVLFHRVAVGEHLILGGDNLDLALAYFIEGRFREEGVSQLTPRQWSVLVRVARQVKEALLSPDAPNQFTVSLPGSGSKLIGGALQTQVTKQQVTDVLLEGFLPQTTFTDVPQSNQSGFREFGLPYAADSAITRYLAEFLRTHAETAAENEMLRDDDHAARPDIVLFNGGLFESALLKQRMTEVLSSWFSEGDREWEPLILNCERLDLAVAQGAACYGMVSRGIGVRISAGLPRTYYLGVETEAGMNAVCLVPAGTEPGTDLDPPEQTFQLQTGRPVEFPVLYSGTRLTDATGTVVESEKEQLTALPPIRTVIRSSDNNAGDTVTVQVNARLTEIGTLDLWCASTTTGERWKLQFDVRSAVRTDVAAHEASAADAEGIVAADTLTQVEAILHSVFGKDGTDKPGGLAKRIGREISMSRSDWPTSLLREMWRVLIELADGRRRSAAHESAWLNLLGFALRPGFGYAMDDWRIDTTWDILRGKLIHATPEVRSQWWIMWRRIAGGLSGGQQNATASQLLSSIRQTAQQMSSGKGKGGPIALHEKDAAEIWRVLGAFEQLPPSVRHELGDIVLQLLPRPKMQPMREALVWTLGRLGSRVPFNGNAQSTVNADTAARWLQQLLSMQLEDVQTLPLAIMQLARRTDDRFTDIPDDVREEAARYLKEMGGYHSLIKLIREAGTTDAETKGALFGEALPLGLTMT
ncbi:hsp70 family protein [Fuerstiella marisgermanici]|uniref:Heat shock protein 70 n=1 Tax=Fuerstiella marisgermanici TaxID=1891926 RepID=A0A1P8WF04_9PLAN|nr:hsp70 family protein [Fuerstiella marisgermanici]APZ92652.1 Heat shock protein 70 [Fuerstiella marisgermanici]